MRVKDWPYGEAGSAAMARRSFPEVESTASAGVLPRLKFASP
jgi:hypothetical protein